jgi:hypothetical protein
MDTSKFVKYHDNSSNVKYEGPYINKKMNGKWSVYDENRKLIGTQEFVDDKKHGMTYQFDVHGNTIKSWEYKNDILVTDELVINMSIIKSFNNTKYNFINEHRDCKSSSCIVDTKCFDTKSESIEYFISSLISTLNYLIATEIDDYKTDAFINDNFNKNYPWIFTVNSIQYYMPMMHVLCEYFEFVYYKTTLIIIDRFFENYYYLSNISNTPEDYIMELFKCKEKNIILNHLVNN